MTRCEIASHLNDYLWVCDMRRFHRRSRGCGNQLELYMGGSHTRGWLFSRFLLLQSHCSLFTRELVVGQVRQILILLGVKGHYSGHSFRRGAATWAKEAGLTDHEIMLLGRWKSIAYRLYVDTHPERILAASRRHQRLPTTQR